MYNEVCMICHDKNRGWQEQNSLKELDRIMAAAISKANAEIPQTLSDRTFMNVLSDDIHFKCKYHLPCDTLRRTERNIKRIASELEKALPVFIEVADSAQIHKALMTLRGDFPRAYRTIELTWRAKQKQNKKETD